MTIFDRYLLARFFQTFGVFIIASYGLYVVIDLFTNVDAFQADAESSADAFRSIIRYYGYHVSDFFEMAGPVLMIVSVISVLGLLQKHQEVKPILAAGIPAARLLRPLLAGSIVINGMLICNQEFLMPAIAQQLQAPRGKNVEQWQQVEPVYDYSYDYSQPAMFISGKQLELSQAMVSRATFMVTSSALVNRVTTLKAESATYQPPTDSAPAGWLLKGIEGGFDPGVLTEEGRKRFLLPADGVHDLFVVSDVTFDRLCSGGRNYKLLSSQQLLERIRKPSTGTVPVSGQSLALHFRVTRPLLSFGNIMIALPLVVRRESRSLILNMAICAGVLGLIFVFCQAFLYLGSAGLVAPDYAAWIPVVFTAAVAVWVFPIVQT